MLTTQFRFGKWHSACCNCAIMQRNWPAHASPGNILKNHPKEDDLQTLIGKKWAEIIDDVILHSFGAKFSHSKNFKKKNVPKFMLTTQFRFGKWHSACCNCAIMQRNWPAHASPGNILKNHPKEDDLQTLIGKKWAEIIDDVILLHSFGAKFSHSNNCKKKNVCFHEMVQEIKVPLFFLSLILLIRTQEWLPLKFYLN